MKNKFNFLQIANWIYVCCENNKKSNYENLSNEQKKRFLESQARIISIAIKVLKREVVLQGINNNFVRNIKEIKKQYGVDE